MLNFILMHYLRGPNNFTSESRVSTAATFESAKSYNSGKCANAVLYKRSNPPKLNVSTLMKQLNNNLNICTNQCFILIHNTKYPVDNFRLDIKNQVKSPFFWAPPTYYSWTFDILSFWYTTYQHLFYH